MPPTLNFLQFRVSAVFPPWFRQGVVALVYFQADEVHACIVTCGDLCPRLNIVIRELVCGLCNMYGVKKVLGIEIVDLKLLILFLLCGSLLEVRRRGLKVSIVGIPKTIDNDILVIDKSFGFDTTV
ncbi:ATP-dependent 6-phosphofructokinase 3-like [Cucumis melo var. makuwa]|uniref:ATP-dependent 6-phosphofructokinase 3-like n=1 Tax=Cucumis melo var. makuwa TaxID=1194695 RepID=A0A5A7UZX1_CUCMM|nr:ATP-dependent 6-phosphofructokinase 3-like [Cucumis melo var. makuwa]